MKPTLDSISAMWRQHFPDGDNKVGHALAKTLLADIVTWGREKDADRKRDIKKAVAEVKKPKETASEYPEDFVGFTPEQRGKEVAKLLDYKLFTRELTASELRELKDIFNLKAADQDIIIEQVDYTAIDPNGASIIDAVNWQIVEYNKKELSTTTR